MYSNCIDPYQFNYYDESKLLQLQPEYKETKARPSTIFFTKNRNKYIIAEMMKFLRIDDTIKIILANSVILKAFAYLQISKILKELKGCIIDIIKTSSFNQIFSNNASILVKLLTKDILKGIDSSLHKIFIMIVGKWLNKYYLETKNKLPETEVNMENISIGLVGAKFLYSILRVNNSLLTLNIPGNNIPFDGMKLVCMGISNLINLEELNLNSNHLNLESSKILSNSLKNKKFLRFLGLSNTNIDDNSVDELASSFENLKYLETLFLDNNKIQSKKAIEKLSESLITTRLIILDLSNNQLNSSSNYLATLIKRLKSLKTLKLSKTVTDYSLLNFTHLFESIVKSNLTFFEMNDCKLKNDNLRCIIEKLINQKTLQNVSMISSFYSMEILPTIRMYLKKDNQHLKSFHVSDRSNTFDQVEINELKKMMKTTKFIF